MKKRKTKAPETTTAGLQIVYRPIEGLIPFARNSRTHSDEQVAQIAGSIREFGFTNPVLIDPDGGIIAGHGRVLASRVLGLYDVPTIELGHLSATLRRAYVIADNKLALNAGWDADMLAVELDELRDLDFDLSLLGFEPQELNDLIGTAGIPPGLTDEDVVPSIRADALSRIGDVWLLGNHRIMCGDSTNADAVATLMAGRKAVLMQTDPPYGIAYNSADLHNNDTEHADIENDDLDGEVLQEFLESVIRAAIPHLEPKTAFYLWHPMLTQGTFFAAAAAADILISRQIIWAKPSLVFGRGEYHWQHELCFYGWRRGFRPPFYGERNQTTLWHIGRETSKEHPTAKPVELWVAPIENHMKPGEVMYEPFSGSGSQIIAAEKTARRCYAMELSPHYVDLAIRRWQEFTGKRATHEATAATFDEVAAERGREVAEAA